MRHKWRLIVPLLVLVGLLGVGVWWLLRHHADQSKTKPTWVVPSAVASAPLSPKTVQTLADQARSGDAKQVSKAVVLPGGNPLPKSALTELHALRSVVLQTGSLHDNGNGTATAKYLVTNPSGNASTWEATLVWSGSAWKLALTSEA